MTHTTKLCRRRWACRGRGLADFTFAFLLTTVGHVTCALSKVLIWALRMAFCRRPCGGLMPERAASSSPLSAATRQSDASAVEADLAAALVSLGMPARHASSRASITVQLHGVLPVEQLIPRALAGDPVRRRDPVPCHRTSLAGVATTHRRC